MDWLRQIPIGQYVDGSAGWLRLIDPRLKLGWVVMFLLTPVLAVRCGA
jgi:energy-coupling factor transport system permease protein